EYLNQACGDDAELRRRLERLLNAHPQVGSFLEQDNQPAETESMQSHREGPGTVIGPYKLLEKLGEGGMGTVWIAERDHPKQRVALKLIKPGMDSNQIIRRFDAERQALALMSHNNIAKMLDA